MQNNILDNNKIVNLTPLTSKKSVSNTTVPTELRSVKDHALASKVVVIKKMEQGKIIISRRLLMLLKNLPEEL